jgi:hypothetical protein
MEEAQSRGAQFWLYVVEFVEDPKLRRLHRIHDPAGRITHYHFDHGWRSYSDGFDCAAAASISPEVGDSIDTDEGPMEIVGLQQAGALLKLEVRQPDGAIVSELYKPGVTRLLKNSLKGASDGTHAT